MAIVAENGGNQPLDQKLSSANRTVADAAARVAATPVYAGEIIRQADTGAQYRGVALTLNAWALMSESASR